ncbi:hypothetical protein Tco_0051772 [Tanacetum coccineum]
MESISYCHQQVLKWQRNWNGQDSSVLCSNSLGHEDTQVYGTILPKELTNQAMLESNDYKTYYLLLERKLQNQSTRLKSKAKVAKPDKKKQPAKKTKAKGLAVLSEVALTKAEQLKMATKRSKTQFYNEGTGTIPGVPDVPIYEFESEKDSWGDSEDEDDKNNSDDIGDEGDDDNDGNNGNDGDDNDANDDDKQEGDDTNDDDKETDSDRTESDRIKIHILNQSTTEYYEQEEEKLDDEEMMYDDEDGEVTKELYKDADQGGVDQQNVSQQLGFEQEEEDAHVTLTPVLDTQKTGGLIRQIAYTYIATLIQILTGCP